MMKHIVQPKGSHVCGQCSVAMLFDLPLEKSFSAFGHEHSTKPDELTRVMRKLGRDVSIDFPVDNRKRVDLSGAGLMLIEYKGSKEGHAMAYKDGKLYDPAGWLFDDVKVMRNKYRNVSGRKIRVVALFRLGISK